MIFHQAPDDPYEDIQLFELVDANGLPDTRGICQACGAITEDADALVCDPCQAAEAADEAGM